jgi:hypothetical protein
MTEKMTRVLGWIGTIGALLYLIFATGGFPKDEEKKPE